MAFKNTILGKILKGVGKVAAVGVTGAAIIGSGGAVAGVLTAGKMATTKTGLFSKIGNLFKKKKGGTVLGNVLRSGAKGAVEGAGAEVGSTVHGIAAKIGGSVEGAEGAFGSGFKEGFLGSMWKKNKGMVIMILVILSGGVIYLLTRKKGRR